MTGEYSDYLLSPEWAKRRDAVIERCSGLCEGCGNAPVDHVHHLTYDNIGDEFLWQLVGVCAPCHARAHGKTKTKRKRRSRRERGKTPRACIDCGNKGTDIEWRGSRWRCVDRDLCRRIVEEFGLRHL